jgi:UDP-N-acetyl-D-mannosaminuronate dehydrogenase
VGSHLVDSFSRNFSVIGFDVSKSRVAELNSKYAENSAAEFTSEAKDLVRATHFLIAVPTLLRADKSIDSSYLRDAIKTVAQVARRGSTVVIESSVAVGMTRELLGPLAVSCGFFAGMSPEVRSILMPCFFSIC